MARLRKRLPRDFYPSLAAALLVMLGLGLIYLLVMERISVPAAFGVLIGMGVAIALGVEAGRRRGD